MARNSSHIFTNQLNVYDIKNKYKFNVLKHFRKINQKQKTYFLMKIIIFLTLHNNIWEMGYNNYFIHIT